VRERDRAAGQLHQVVSRDQVLDGRPERPSPHRKVVGSDLCVSVLGPQNFLTREANAFGQAALRPSQRLAPFADAKTCGLHPSGSIKL